MTTLLKAYLSGSTDPIFMANVYLGQLLKMPIRAVLDEAEQLFAPVADEEGMRDLREEFNYLEGDIKEIKSDIKEYNEILRLYEKNAATGVKPKPHPAFVDSKKKLKSAYQELTRLEPQLNELKKTYNGWLNLVLERDGEKDVTREQVAAITGADESGLSKKEEIKILEIGIELLRMDKKRLKIQHDSVLKLPDPKEVDKLREEQNIATNKVKAKGKPEFAENERGKKKRVPYSQELTHGERHQEMSQINTLFSRKINQIFEQDSNLKSREKVVKEIRKISIRIDRGLSEIKRRKAGKKKVSTDVEEDWEPSKDWEQRSQSEDKVKTQLQGKSAKGFQTRGFIETLADTSKSFRTDRRRDNFIRDLYEFLNHDDMQITSLPKPYSAKKWADIHGLGKVQGKTKTLAPPSHRLLNIKQLRHVLNNAPSSVKEEHSHIHKRILAAIEEEIKLEEVRAKKWEQKLTVGGEKRGELAVSGLVEVLKKMKSSLRGYDFEEPLPKTFREQLIRLGRSSLKTWDLTKLSKGKMLEDKFKGMFSEDMLEPITKLLNSSIRGEKTLINVIIENWSKREDVEEETEGTRYIQEYMDKLYLELNPYLSGEEEPEEEIPIDYAKRAKTFLNSLVAIIKRLDDENITEDSPLFSGIMEDVKDKFSHLDNIMNEIENSLEEEDRKALESIRDKFRKHLDIHKTKKPLPHKMKSKLESILKALYEYVVEVQENAKSGGTVTIHVNPQKDAQIKSKRKELIGALDKNLSDEEKETRIEHINESYPLEEYEQKLGAEEWVKHYLGKEEEIVIGDDNTLSLREVEGKHKNINDKLRVYVDGHLPYPDRQDYKGKNSNYRYKNDMDRRKALVRQIVRGEKIDIKDLKWHWKPPKMEKVKSKIEEDIEELQDIELDEEYDETDVGERETEEILEGREISGPSEKWREEQEALEFTEDEETGQTSFREGAGGMSVEEYEEQRAEEDEERRAREIDESYEEEQQRQQTIEEEEEYV